MLYLCGDAFPRPRELCQDFLLTNLDLPRHFLDLDLECGEQFELSLLQPVQKAALAFILLLLLLPEVPQRFALLQRLLHFADEDSEGLDVVPSVLGGALALHAEQSPRFAMRSQADVVQRLLRVLLFLIAFGVLQPINLRKD